MVGKNKKLARWRRRRAIKKQAVEYKGGKCCKCGYDRLMSALVFHHIDPSKKEFGISSQGCSRSWERVKKEVDKCILVCHNCHAEIHDEIAEKPEQPEIRERESRKVSVECAQCKIKLITYRSRAKRSTTMFCGKECKNKFYRHKWPTDEKLIAMFDEIGVNGMVEQLGIGRTSIYNRLAKIT
jgi:transcription elongation factor Elf1